MRMLTILIFAVALMLSASYGVIQAEDDVKDLVIEKVGELMNRLEPLSRDGMDTSIAEHYINQALAVLNTGCRTAECVEWVWGNLSAAEREISKLEDQYPRYIMLRNLTLGGTIVVLAAIPVIVYLFLPRIWAYVWYVARRKWIVVEKKTRGGRKR